jgi:galactose-1-phosphate uridylyltransferase
MLSAHKLVQNLDKEHEATDKEQLASPSCMFCYVEMKYTGISTEERDCNFCFQERQFSEFMQTMELL